MNSCELELVKKQNRLLEGNMVGSLYDPKFLEHSCIEYGKTLLVFMINITWLKFKAGHGGTCL